MEAKNCQVDIEITRLVDLTRSGKLEWERVGEHSCVYRTCNMRPQVTVSCLQPNCRIEIENRQMSMDCEDLAALCHEIVQQRKQKVTQTSEVLKLLQAATIVE